MFSCSSSKSILLSPQRPPEPSGAFHRGKESGTQTTAERAVANAACPSGSILEVLYEEENRRRRAIEETPASAFLQEMLRHCSEGAMVLRQCEASLQVAERHCRQLAEQFETLLGPAQSDGPAASLHSFLATMPALPKSGSGEGSGSNVLFHVVLERVIVEHLGSTQHATVVAAAGVSTAGAGAVAAVESLWLRFYGECQDLLAASTAAAVSASSSYEAATSTTDVASSAGDPDPELEPELESAALFASVPTAAAEGTVGGAVLSNPECAPSGGAEDSLESAVVNLMAPVCRGELSSAPVGPPAEGAVAAAVAVAPSAGIAAFSEEPAVATHEEGVTAAASAATPSGAAAVAEVGVVQPAASLETSAQVPIPEPAAPLEPAVGPGSVPVETPPHVGPGSVPAGTELVAAAAMEGAVPAQRMGCPAPVDRANAPVAAVSSGADGVVGPPTVPTSAGALPVDVAIGGHAGVQGTDVLAVSEASGSSADTALKGDALYMGAFDALSLTAPWAEVVAQGGNISIGQLRGTVGHMHRRVKQLQEHGQGQGQGQFCSSPLPSPSAASESGVL